MKTISFKVTNFLMISSFCTRTVSRRNISSWRGVFVSGRKQGWYSEIAKKKWYTSSLQNRRQNFKSEQVETKIARQNELFCSANYEAPEIEGNRNK